MNNIGIGLEIMGTGMLGLFVAMIIIMARTGILKALDNKKKK